jgi:AraC-like DNA-binding protein
VRYSDRVAASEHSQANPLADGSPAVHGGGVSISRAPSPALRPFVKTLWARQGLAAPTPHEHVLPNGMMHVVLRLSPEPIVIFDGGSPRDLGHSVIGGARSTYYLKDVSAPSTAVGAQLHPGAASLLFGMPADELAERHTALEDVWGAEARRLRDYIGEACTLEARLDRFEAALAARLPRVRGVHPAIADALARVASTPIAELVGQSGMSHRSFIALFRATVGLAPKTFARIVRFQRAAARLATERVSLADTAFDAGYADQAHLTREFGEIAGVSPARYRALEVTDTNHVPIMRR